MSVVFPSLCIASPASQIRLPAGSALLLELRFFEGDKSFPIIDRFHGVVDDFRIVALIRKKGTPLQRDDLVGCGEDVNGNCGIHDVGWCGQLV